MVLHESPLRSRATGTELGAIKAHEIVEIVAQQVHQHFVMAALNNAVVKIEIAFALVVSFAALQVGLAFV